MKYHWKFNGDNRWDCINDSSGLIGYVLGKFDAHGVVKFEPYRPDREEENGVKVLEPCNTLFDAIQKVEG